MGNRDWTWEEYNYLYNYYHKMSDEEIGAQLGRTPISVRIHSEKLNIKKNISLTDEERNLMKAYGSKLGTAMMFLIPGYSTVVFEEPECVSV